MQLTNKFGIPETVLRAIRADDYSRGESDISVTGLLRPPQMSVLEKKHHEEIEIDARDEVWKLWGQAVHTVIEKANRGRNEQQVERRLFAEIGGWRLSGQTDSMDETSEKLTDFKVTTEFTARQEKPEWEQQLNCYAYLWRVAEEIEMKELEVVAILRDWRRAEAERNPDYPQAPVITIPINIWPAKDQHEFILNRIVAHRNARLRVEQGATLPPCTDEERWQRPIKFAVKKIGGKRAVRIYDSEAEALAALSNGQEIEQRGGGYVRCEGWCSVSRFCDQWKKENGNG